MKARLFYYLLVVPVSVLPLPVLWAIGRVFLFIFYNIFGYRKTVVAQNIARSFPDLSPEQRAEIQRKFYRHLGDMFAEGVKGYTISKKNVLKRFSFTNPEIIEDYYKQGRSVLLVGAHYNNWEFLVLSLDLHFSQQGTGVGQKISNKSFGAMMEKTRARFDMEVWTNENVRQNIEYYQQAKEPFVCLLLADQSPKDPQKAFWMRFLNQDTPVIFGPEYLAKKYNIPVMYYTVAKVKRGVYRATLIPITNSPITEPDGEITYRHAKILEQEIIAKPEFWLWSHRRWKHAKQAKGKQIRA